MKFKCLHCGRCCVNVCTQINVTLGDIKRISEFINKPIEYFFEKHIGINPFGDPENKNFYDYELGLNIPCNIRVNKRCVIYEARPLNCRLFPYWILANAPKEEIKEIIDNTHKCIIDFEFDERERPKYREFFGKMSNVLLRESKITDEFMEKNNFKDSIKLSVDNISNEEKIKMCVELLNKEKYKNLVPLIKKEIKNNKFISLEEIKKTQKILD